MKGMRVKKGWKDDTCTIPNYVYVNKIDMMFTNDNSIFHYIKDRLLKNNGDAWMVENKKSSWVVEPGNVYWFNDRPIAIFINTEVMK